MNKQVFSEAEVKQYYENMKNDSIGPLWHDLGHMVTKEPVHDVEPYLWKWKTIRDYAMTAGDLLEPGKDAERRVVYLQNPSLLKRGLVGYGTHTLYAGIQLLLPGEMAPSHHHSQTAIRFIIEGDGGAYTAVNGERSYMKRGDMILTPAWTWHEHKHEGTEPMFWMDGLDVGLVRTLAASFFEPYEGGFYPEEPPENYSTKKLTGGAFAAKGETVKPGYPSPIFNYTWERAQYELEQLSKSTDNEDPFDGYAIEYINPTTGGPADSRIGTMMQKLLPGQHTKSHRHVHSCIYHVLEGSGYTVIDGEKFEWEKGDFFILPPYSWHEHVNEGQEDAHLFSINDKPVMEKLELEFGDEYKDNNGHQPIEKVFQPSDSM
ncbi:gentisate 1,2-dioxygenase [Alteribacillus persepolensis]|uniref:Gentisate 1,2-dioxygenase n=1 Tax=Alteribacillus persepolensis TaxID=568899 RepID=A0A1G8A8P2_9BACI|nr:cupin domain-containing protein [Alteribacillus persepolensis]SDH17243.1 gentisate 1,2-dioxygenase [Alteribacillus persepolensis]